MKLLACILVPVVLCSSGAVLADQFYTGERMTLRFGMEQDFSGSTRIDAVHTDVEIDYDAGARLAVGVDLGASVGSPAASHFYGNTATRFTPATIPASFAFLGGTAGQTMWVLPQSQFAGRVYLGMDSQQITTADRDELATWNPGDPRNSANTTDKYIEVQLLAARGPAGSSVSLYQTNAQGQPVVHWSSFDGGISEQDSILVRTVGHQHFNWAFTKSGLYELDVQLRTYTSLNLLQGDADRDNDVDLVDFNRLVVSFGKWGIGWAAGDFTGDGYADIEDFFLLQQNFGAGTNLSPSVLADEITRLGFMSIPEPAALWVAGVAAVGLRRRRVPAGR